MCSVCILVSLFLYSNSQQPASFPLHNLFSPCYQVHNFMLGLNLNISIPFSPLTEVTYHGPPPEEEVDAVTGKNDRRNQLFLRNSKGSEKKNGHCVQDQTKSSR